MLIRSLLCLPARGRRRVERLIQAGGSVIVDSTSFPRIWERLKNGDCDLLVLHHSFMPSPPGGLVTQIRQLPERPEIIVVWDREDAAERASLLAAGSLAVLSLEVSDEILGETLRALLHRLREGALVKGARPEERYSLDDFISASPAMQQFLALARRVVRTDSSLLILGETGVGKERLARAIQAESVRAAGPFIALNCGALPESLLESELFGHEIGAFTGATRARRGYFEMAHRGTLFLDEVGEMPLHLQVKLLRVLEDHRIQRVGAERPIDVDVRVVAATNKDLETEVHARRFRQDLYFRLAVVTLTLPAVRERREDVPQLVLSYLDHFNKRVGRRLEGVSPEAMETLTGYGWPGNVRELINVMERLVLLSAGPFIEVSDLPHRIRAEGMSRESDLPRAQTDRPWREARREALDSLEKAYFTGLLQRTGGRIGETASLAGIDPRSVHEMMKRHGLRKADFRGPRS